MTIKRHLVTLLIGVVLITPLVSQALSFDPNANDPGSLISNTTGNINSISLGQQQPTVIALRLINAALSLLAIICVVLLIYAGFLWIWARGNQDEVKRAKDIILGTVIGLVIVLAALGITQFVFSTIGDITGATVV